MGTVESLGQQNMSDNEKLMWLIDNMFLKTKNAKWVAIFLMLETQPRATYNERTYAIAAYQTKLGLLEADEKNKNLLSLLRSLIRKRKMQMILSG